MEQTMRLYYSNGIYQINDKLMKRGSMMVNYDVDTEALIIRAVEMGIQAGRKQACDNSKSAFRLTERRLYALPVLEKKILADRDKLTDLKQGGLHERSKSIIRLHRPGYRISPEDMLNAVVKDLEASIAADEHEIETVRWAMEMFSDDPYYYTVTGKYFYRYDDDDIAEDLNCGTTHVWKQRTRIVKDISVMLYGSSAV